MLRAAACGCAVLPTSPYIPGTSAERRPLMHSLPPDLRRKDKEGVFDHRCNGLGSRKRKIVQHSAWGKITCRADPPDCPGGGMPPGPLGNLTKIDSTAALFPKQGSKAIGLGTDCMKRKREIY